MKKYKVLFALVTGVTLYCVTPFASARITFDASSTPYSTIINNQIVNLTANDCFGNGVTHTCVNFFNIGGDTGGGSTWVSMFKGTIGSSTLINTRNGTGIQDMEINIPTMTQGQGLIYAVHRSDFNINYFTNGTTPNSDYYGFYQTYWNQTPSTSTTSPNYLIVLNPTTNATTTSPINFQFQYKIDTNDYGADLKKLVVEVFNLNIVQSTTTTRFVIENLFQDISYFENYQLNLAEGFYIGRAFIEDSNGNEIPYFTNSIVFTVGNLGQTTQEILKQDNVWNLATEKCNKYSDSWFGTLTIGGLCRLGYYLFVPSISTMSNFDDVPKMIFAKMPFNYLQDGKKLFDEFTGQTATTTATSTQAFVIQGNTYKVNWLPFEQANQYTGVSTIRNFFKLILYFITGFLLVYWVYHRI